LGKQLWGLQDTGGWADAALDSISLPITAGAA
jgi:hypothetical protein